MTVADAFADNAAPAPAPIEMTTPVDPPVATPDNENFVPQTTPPPMVHIELPPPPDVAGPFKPTYESLKAYACPQWYADAKFGIWAHWGPQGVAGEGDWYARRMYDPTDDAYKYSLATYGPQSQFGYKDIIALWKAEKFDPNYLMGLYKAAGAKYFVSMACHHDNFDLWNSKYQRWNAVNMGPHEDIVGMWEAAARKHGMKFGVSEHMAVSYKWYSIAHSSDKTGPYAGIPYDANDPQYADLYGPKPERIWEPGGQLWDENGDPEWWKYVWYRRVWDLLSRYKPDYLYSDFGNVPFRQEYGWRLLANYYNQSVRDNHGSMNVVYTGKGDTQRVYTRDYEAGLAGDIKPEPWQTDTAIGSFFYTRNDHYRSADSVIRLLADIVSKNGNLLLAVTQKPDGSLEQPEIDTLRQMAAWMKINGEAIFATRPFNVAGEGPTQVSGLGGTTLPYTPLDIRYTTKGDTLYAILLGWPGQSITLKSLESNTPFCSGDVKQVVMLGSSGPLTFTRDSSGLTVELPATPPCSSAYVLKITGLSDIKYDGLVYPNTSNVFNLPASSSIVHGSDINLSNTAVQNWTDASGYVTWHNIKIVNPGKYNVTVTAATPVGPSVVDVNIAGATSTTNISATSTWDDDAPNQGVQITIDKAGVYQVLVKPHDPATWKPINMTGISLAPV